MTKTGLALLSVVFGLLASPARAAEVAGQWRGEFESPRGVQKYLFTFQTDGGKLTGKAVSEAGERKREAELQEGTVSGNTLSFVEPLSFQGNTLNIQYTGKLAGNEIQFTRKVGDFGTTEFVATRAPAAGAAPAATTPAPARTRGLRRAHSTATGRQASVRRSAGGDRHEARRHSPRPAGDGRVRVQDGRHHAQNAGVHATRLLEG